MKILSSLSKKFILIPLLLVLSFPAWAGEVVFKMANDRIFVGDFIQVEEAQGTLVLLPGINRALEEKSEVKYFKALKQQKFNVLTLATSSHPRSISALPVTEVPQFLKRNFTMKDYAEEIEFAVQELKLDHPMVISLSYSSAILAFLDPSRFSEFVESVPMADPLEGADAVTLSARQYQDMLKLNPFGGAQLVRAQRDSAYRLNWQESVRKRISQSPKSYGAHPRLNDIIEGYVSLTRAAEDFRLIEQIGSPLRHFIIAGKENSARLSLQIDCIKKQNSERDSRKSVLLVEDSGHILPSDEPIAAAKALGILFKMQNSRYIESGKVSDKDFLPFSSEDRQKYGLK